MQWALIFYGFFIFSKYGFQDPLETLPSLQLLFPVFSTLISDHFSPLPMPWPLLYRGSHWVVTSQLVACMWGSALVPFIHLSSFPLSMKEVSCLRQCSLTSGPMLQAGPGWLEAVSGVYVKSLGTLKWICSAPQIPTCLCILIPQTSGNCHQQDSRSKAKRGEWPWLLGATRYRKAW